MKETRLDINGPSYRQHLARLCTESSATDTS